MGDTLEREARMRTESSHAGPTRDPGSDVAPLGPAWLALVAGVVAACALAYGTTVLAPYLADRPGASPPSGASATLGLLASLVTPFACVTGALLVGGDVLEAVRTGRRGRAVAPAALVLGLCLLVLAAYVALGPVTRWWWD